MRFQKSIWDTAKPWATTRVYLAAADNAAINASLSGKRMDGCILLQLRSRPAWRSLFPAAGPLESHVDIVVRGQQRPA